MSTAEPTWEPPGPGTWICDRSHSSGSPTPLYRRIAGRHTEPVYRRVMQQFGGAVGTIELQFVHGALYRRIVPLIAPTLDTGRVPPKPILWLLSRLHPEFRRRERTARRTLDERTFERGISHWIEHERHEWIAINTELEQIDVAALDDAALADHIDHLDHRLVVGWERHHELHAYDLGPIGDLLVHGTKWGIDQVEIMGLLRGSSPATVAAAEHGVAIASALRRGGVDPATVTTLDQIRSVSEAAANVDTYLALFGWRLITDYDIDGLTLHELPGAVVALVRRAAGDSDAAAVGEVGAVGAVGAGSVHDLSEAQLRAKADDGELFDHLLTSARAAYGVRDDNGPLTWAWPAGLMRRAYLEAGRRMVDKGHLDHVDHVFELDVDELTALLRQPDLASPSSGELAARAQHRRWEASLTSPDILGPAPADPDTSALPPSIRRIMDIIVATTSLLEPEPGDAPIPLTGLGIGRRPHTGVARVVDDPVVAIAQMEPGDVLVAPWTSPSFNAVFSIAGAVVVQEGALLCHAAVMARELDIAAVVGCRHAMTSIRSGDVVTVDPASGTVVVVDSPASSNQN